MKKLFLLLFAVSALNGLKAQRFDGGVTFGLAMSQIDGDRLSGFHQPGIIAGFYTFTDISKYLVAQVELKYVAKGARETGTLDDPSYNSTKLRYIEMPLKLILPWEQYKTHFEAGLVPGYLFNFQYNDAYGVLAGGGENLRKYELEGILGLSYDLNERVRFNITYNYSLIPIRKYNNDFYRYGSFAQILKLVNGDYNNSVMFSIYLRLGY